MGIRSRDGHDEETTSFLERESRERRDREYI